MRTSLIAIGADALAHAAWLTLLQRENPQLGALTMAFAKDAFLRRAREQSLLFWKQHGDLPSVEVLLTALGTASTGRATR